MIGFVIVSHSEKLAEGVRELAVQAAQGRVRVAAAGGTSDAEHPLGTDAFKVQAAIEAADSGDGVIVLMDLGSAILSAETALELLSDELRGRVQLCAAPLVEGAVAAVTLAAAGAGIGEILREAQAAAAAKITQIDGKFAVNYAANHGPRETAQNAANLATRATAPGRDERAEQIQEIEAKLLNRLGLHARPAAQLVRLARGFDAEITVENLSSGAGPYNAASINGVLSLGARQGHRLRIRARGKNAQNALAEIEKFLASGCGEGENALLSDHAVFPPEAEANLSPVTQADLERAAKNEAAVDAGSEAPDSARDAGNGVIAGAPGSAGIAIGPLLKLKRPIEQATRRSVDDPQAEGARFQSALSSAKQETRALYDWARAHAGADEAGIFDAQLLFLDDPSLVDAASHRILADRVNAEFAWQTETEKFADRIRALDDPYLRGRAADIGDVRNRVLAQLSGAPIVMPILRQPAIVAAHDLAPSDVKDLNPAMTVGVCLESGGATAHCVILLRSMGIPAVVGLGPGISAIDDGITLAIDGEQGRVWIAPTADQVREIETRRAAWLAARRIAQERRVNPAATRDGRRIQVLANLKSTGEAARAVENGAEGSGLVRTEFLFLRRDRAPDEEEQFSAYRAIADAFGKRRVVIRTLDIGGDKRVPYLDFGNEDNPQLGWRGVRVMLDRRDLLRTQLRAILRAGHEHHVEIMFPMISTVDELRRLKAAFGEVKRELEREGIAFNQETKAGIMIEVPAAVAVADRLAREADFFSIGSNDLTQYVMAADRGNARVAGLADGFQPAVLRMLRETIGAARAARTGVSLCGEMAGDTLATPLLLGLGLEEFSASPALIPALKLTIASWTIAEAEAIAREALTLDSSDAVRRLLADARASRGAGS